jgi:hypothetical protein
MEMLYVLYQRGDLLKAAYNLPCFFTKWDKGRLFLGGKHYDLNSRKDAKTQRRELKKVLSWLFCPDSSEGGLYSTSNETKFNNSMKKRNDQKKG